MNLYNENNPKAAAWIRELINLKLIPNGTVDTRSITDISPADLAGFTQCHFFCGISGWSLALRLAGVPDTKRLWTGSAPCQPFSDAGLGKGFDDERHLWPAWFRLVRECKPDLIIGEQVSSKAALSWFDGVCSDLEGEGYACGALDLCAAGIGETGHPLTQESAAILRALAERTDISDALREQLLASAETVAGLLVGGPHIRSRLYWMAYAQSQLGAWSERDRNATGSARLANGRAEGDRWNGEAGGSSSQHCGLGIPDRTGREQGIIAATGARHGDSVESAGGLGCGMGDTIQPRLEGHAGDGDHGDQPRRERAVTTRPVATAGRASHWGDFDILPCLDGKARRVESGAFPLVAGLPGGVGHSSDPSAPITVQEANATPEGRVMRLHGYGNALCIPVAVEFIETVMEILP